MKSKKKTTIKIMKTTTAKVITSNGESKFIAGATNYKGYLVTVVQKGVGEAVEKGCINSEGEGETWEEYDKYEDFNKPYFNSEKLKSAGLLDRAKKDVDGKSIEQIFGTEYEQFLIKWGDNEFGLIVTDNDAQKHAEMLETKKVFFIPHYCWETGLTYWELAGPRYPENVFKIMNLMYHNEQIEEEGEWKGWYTMSLEVVHKELQKIEWSCM